STITSAPCSTRSRIAAMSRMTSVGLTCTTSRSIFPIIAVLLLLRPLLRRLKRKATRRGHPPPLPCCCCSWWLPPNHPQTLPGSRDPADRMKSSCRRGTPCWTGKDYLPGTVFPARRKTSARLYIRRRTPPDAAKAASLHLRRPHLEWQPSPALFRSLFVVIVVD